MQTIGGAVLVFTDGCISLSNSEFRTNSEENSTGGIGIVNRGGEVLCDVTGCLQVCTQCKDYPVPSAWPSSSPTMMPTVSLHPTLSLPPTPNPTVAERRETNNLVVLWLVVAGLALCMSIAVPAEWWRRTRRRRGLGPNSNHAAHAAERTALSSYRAPLLGQDATNNEPESLVSVELVGHAVLKTYELSLAPTFVVGCVDMRITIWSPGMESVAPLHVDPVGSLLVDLPFVNPNDGDRLFKKLDKIFAAPAEHDCSAKVFALYLTTLRGAVLLEMRADHLVSEAEPIIVLTGRMLDADLACMMAYEGSAVAPSEANGDSKDDNGETPDAGIDQRFRSVSEVGSAKGDDDDILLPTQKALTIFSSEPSDSIISELTMPTLSAPSKASDDRSAISSLTMSSAFRSPSAARASTRASPVMPDGASLTINPEDTAATPPEHVDKRASEEATEHWQRSQVKGDVLVAKQAFEAERYWQMSLAKGDALLLLDAGIGFGWCEVAHVGAPEHKGKVPCSCVGPAAASTRDLRSEASEGESGGGAPGSVAQAVGVLLSEYGK